MEIGSMFAIAFVVVAIVVVFSGVKTVKQGWEFTVERFGRFTRSLRPGFHFIIPFIDRIGAKMNMMENVLDVPPQDVITKDNAMIRGERRTVFPSVGCGQGSV